jgi:hypothetical protein
MTTMPQAHHEVNRIGPQQPPSIPEFGAAPAQEQHAAANGETIPVLAMTEPHITVAMEVVQVRIFQPAGHPEPAITSAPVALIAQPVQAYVALKLEAFLVATEPATDKPVVLAAHFFARDLSSGQKSLLGHTQAILTGNLYRFALANVTLQPGTYRIQLWMTIRGAAGLGYLELPLLRVT